MGEDSDAERAHWVRMMLRERFGPDFRDSLIKEVETLRVEDGEREIEIEVNDADLLLERAGRSLISLPPIEEGVSDPFMKEVVLSCPPQSETEMYFSWHREELRVAAQVRLNPPCC